MYLKYCDTLVCGPILISIISMLISILLWY